MRLTAGPSVNARPILPVRDMREAAEFYRALGFEVEGFDGGYAWVRHDGAELMHLRQVPDLDPEGNAASCYLFVQGVDAWHARWSQSGPPVDPVIDQPWGMREFAVVDPSGNIIRVGQNR